MKTKRIYNGGTGDLTTNYTFDGDLVASDGSNSVTWDENGRQTCQLSADPNDYLLDYDWDSRLRKGQYGDPNNYMEAVYAPDGARIAKKRVWSDNSDYNHKYIVDVVGDVPVVLLVLDADNSNAILKTYIHANGQVLMQHDGDTSANKYFYLYDRLGSVRQVINSSGNVVNCYTYDPWGLTIGSETNETVNNLYRFANYAWEAEVNQYHCFRRQYDPLTFRFTSRDPVLGGFKEPMTLHAYLYCLNDPVNRIDPSGEFFVGMLDTMNAMAIRGGNQGASAGFACRALWMVKNIVRSINALNHIRTLAMYSDAALGLGSTFMRAALVAGKGSFMKGLVAIGSGLGTWQARDPGGPQDVFGVIIDDPHTPTSKSGMTALAIRKYLEEMIENETSRSDGE